MPANSRTGSRPKAIHCQRGDRKCKQKQKRIAEADLRQRVFKGEIRLWRYAIERRKIPSAIRTKTAIIVCRKSIAETLCPLRIRLAIE